jgi:hypothetical protein
MDDIPVGVQAMRMVEEVELVREMVTELGG